MKKTFAFVVLDYAQSDLDDGGTPFLIALRIENEFCLHIFLLRDWEMQIPANSWEKIYISDFIHEFRLHYFKDLDALENFFHFVEALSIGPIRASTSGRVTLPTDLYGQQLGTRSEDIVLCEAPIFGSFLETLSKQPQLKTDAAGESEHA